MTLVCFLEGHLRAFLKCVGVNQDSALRDVEKEITELYEWVQTTLDEMP